MGNLFRRLERYIARNEYPILVFLLFIILIIGISHDSLALFFIFLTLLIILVIANKRVRARRWLRAIRSTYETEWYWLLPLTGLTFLSIHNDLTVFWLYLTR